MKKSIYYLIMCFFILISSINCYAINDRIIIVDNNIKFIIDGKPANFKYGTIRIKDEFLLPYNELLPGIGITNDNKHIIWDANKKSLTIIKNSLNICLNAGSNKALVNGKSINLTAVPTMHKNIFYIPAKFISEKLNKKFKYEASISTVLIYELKSFADKIPQDEDIYGVTMKKGNKVLFAIKKVKSDSSDWKVTAPIECYGDSNGISGINHNFIDVDKYRLIDSDPVSLEKYGLAKPLYIIEYTTKKGINKIYLGKEIKDYNQIYAMLNDKKVYMIDFLDDNLFHNPLKEVVDPFAYIVGIWEVKRLEVKFDNVAAVCDIKASQGGSEKDTFIVNGKNANKKDENDSSLFRNFYMSVIGITISDVEPGAVPKGTPEIVFTYSLKVAPYKMVIGFIPKDENYYYVMKNGKYSSLIVAKSAFAGSDGLRESYKKLIDGINKP